jgi:group I intron endonuclease
MKIVNKFNKKLTKVSGVYRIVCLVTKKCYVGSAKNLALRIWQHESTLRRQAHENPYLQNAFNKYEEDSFEIEILQIVYSKNLIYRRKQEQYWIDYYQSYLPEKGYNIYRRADGKEKCPMTQEQKDRISKTLKRKYAIGEIVNPFTGRHHSRKTKKVLSKANTGRKLKPFTQEHKDKIGANTRRCWKDPKYRALMLEVNKKRRKK